MNNFREMYKDYENKTHEELTKTGIFFAFSNEQFDENKIPKDAPDNEFVSVGAGAYIHKSNADKLNNYFNVILPQLQKELTTKINIEDFILYELYNYEAFYTGDITEAVDIILDFYKDIPKADIIKLMQEVYKKELKGGD
jgi:hypothetical protein